MRQLACATAIALLVLVPAGARAAVSKTDRVAAANAFAKRTLSFEKKRLAAQNSARAKLRARRTAAQGCLAIFKSAPSNRREDLKTIYFEYLSGGLWLVDAPLLRSWIVDLRRSRRIDRTPGLAQAADALKRQYNVADRFYTAFPDVCATVAEWQRSGWSEAGRDTALFALGGPLDDPPLPGDAERLSRARAQLVSTARNGMAAAKIVRIGSDEPDERVHYHTGCDAVGALLFPERYPGCAP